MVGLLGLPLLTLTIPDFTVTIPYLPMEQQARITSMTNQMASPREIRDENLEEITNIAPIVIKEKSRKFYAK